MRVFKNAKRDSRHAGTSHVCFFIPILNFNQRRPLFCICKLCNAGAAGRQITAECHVPLGRRDGLCLWKRQADIYTQRH